MRDALVRFCGISTVCDAWDTGVRLVGADPDWLPSLRHHCVDPLFYCCHVAFIPHQGLHTASARGCVLAQTSVRPSAQRGGVHVDLAVCGLLRTSARGYGTHGRNKRYLRGTPLCAVGVV